MMTILSVILFLQGHFLSVDIPIRGDLEACAAAAPARIEQMLAADYQGARIDRVRCEERP